MKQKNHRDNKIEVETVETVESDQPKSMKKPGKASTEKREIATVNYPLGFSEDRISAYRNLDKARSSKSLESYYAAIGQIQVLTVDEENELALRYQEHGDTEAARLLALSNLRFVAHIAKTYTGYGLSKADLIQEGNVGLVKAIKLFDPRKKKGARLISFAVHWIKSEIQEYILQNWRLVKVATTKQQRKLFYNLRSSKKTTNLLSVAEATDMAHDLDVSIKEVFEMEKRLTRVELPYEEVIDEESTHSSGSIIASQDNVSQEVEDQITQEKEREALIIALQKLDERSRKILQMRWMTSKKTTLSDIAVEFDISIERVRQIEAEAIRKLKVYIESEIMKPLNQSATAITPRKSKAKQTRKGDNINGEPKQSTAEKRG